MLLDDRLPLSAALQLTDVCGASVHLCVCACRIYRLGPGGGIMLVAFDFFNNLLDF